MTKDCVTQVYKYDFSTHILTRRMTKKIKLYCFIIVFQLTSSQGGWRECNASKCPLCFSTHILTRRMTGVGGEKETAQKFSTHILTRRMTSYPIISISIAIFQLTSSQGGWLGSANCSFFAVLFQLTSSQGGWLDIQSSEQTGNDFSTHILTRRMTHFVANNLWKIIFSTHILTRRMTMNVATDDVSENFSTHILTRRMTICIVVDELISTFQLTSSQGGWLSVLYLDLIIYLFNSHPHKEDDVNTSPVNPQPKLFNSHPHKEDDL